MHSARRGGDGANDTDGSFVPGNVCSKCRRAPADGTKLSVCSGCLSTRYCGSTCQRGDWEEHKLGCAAFGAVRESTLKHFENKGPGSAKKNMNESKGEA
jgi:hypothetical protein